MITPRSVLGQMDISKAINTAVDDLFPRFSKDKVLQVHVTMSIENYYAPVKRSFKEFYLLYYRPHNYTFVGAYEGENSIPDKVGIETELEYLSFHDSCWRTDGTECFINRKCEELESEFGEDNITSETYIYNNFGLFGFRILDAVVKTNSNDNKAIFSPVEKLEETI